MRLISVLSVSAPSTNSCMLSTPSLFLSQLAKILSDKSLARASSPSPGAYILSTPYNGAICRFIKRNLCGVKLGNLYGTERENDLKLFALKGSRLQYFREKTIGKPINQMCYRDGRLTLITVVHSFKSMLPLPSISYISNAHLSWSFWLAVEVMLSPHMNSLKSNN